MRFREVERNIDRDELIRQEEERRRQERYREIKPEDKKTLDECWEFWKGVFNSFEEA